jgi:GTP cyclohydrolase I
MDMAKETDISEAERIEAVASHMREIIRLLGEDPDREGLIKTPMRSAKALWKATEGYRMNSDVIVNGALFENPGRDIVTVNDIEFYSMCEHHILPFFGKVSVAYLPADKIIGLSKLARLVDLFARRLQLQERFTSELCEEIGRVTGARGVMVLSRAEHLCMKMRGVEKQGASTVIVETSGLFSTDDNMRARAMSLLTL